MKRLAAFFATALLFSSCSTTPKAYKTLPSKEKKVSYKLQKQNFVTQALYREYKKWAGVQYCYGGEDKNGMDCSALVQTIYKEAFNIKLPRTTKEQIKRGKRVSKKSLKEGDILFFKTSYNVLHTGKY